MKTKGFLFALGLVALSAAGCGDDTNNTEPQEITFDNFPTKLAEAGCENIYSCCTAMERPDFFPYIGINPPPTTQAECITALKMGFDFSKAKTSIDAGRAAFDAAQANICLSKIRETCPLLLVDFNDATCETVFVGLVPDGGSCTTSEECAMAGSSECVGMTCQPLAKEGEPCLNSGCAEGLVCDSGSLCIQPRPDGQMCAGDAECVSQLCDFNTSLCTPKKPNGAPCSPSSFECADGYCDDITQVCTPKKAPGMLCMSAQECLCDMGTCREEPPACDGP